MLKLRFLTKNQGKFAELRQLLQPEEVELIPDATEIQELQTEDMDALIRDKTLKAFKQVRHPVIVDHTGLSFGLLNGFPAGLTSVFYDRLGNDGIASLIGQSADPSVTAITILGYCDGRKIHIFKGEARGKITDNPRGEHGFQWDKVFVPDDHEQTYAELGAIKNEISMRRRAFDKFADFLKGEKHA